MTLLALACNTEGAGAKPITLCASRSETPTSGPTEAPIQQPQPTDIEETPAVGEVPTIK